MFNPVFILVCLANACLADVSHILPIDDGQKVTTPPRPYSFQYSAGRFPGHVDRVQQESSDGSGVIRGSYAFVDPKHKLRKVEYTADKNGFHPTLINYEDTQALPVNSQAVQAANEKHYELYRRIAEANSRADARAVYSPRETNSVQRATAQHLALYAKIADEHAAIGAERQREEEHRDYESRGATSYSNCDGNNPSLNDCY